MDVPDTAVDAETNMNCWGAWLVLGVLATGCAQTPGKEKPMENEAWRKLVDEQRAAKVPVVLRVHLLQHEGGDKWGWDKVKLVGVIKNTSSYHFPGEFQLAHYSAEPGVPDGDSTVYLEQYNPANHDVWKLLDGSGTAGVSHPSGK